jgi:hypothetical protein
MEYIIDNKNIGKYNLGLVTITISEWIEILEFLET